MKLLPMVTLFLAGTAMLWGRTWTSADGEMEFEGAFQSFTSETDTVTVLIEGESQEFAIAKLGEADQEFVKSQGAPSEGVNVTEMLAKAELSQIKDGKFAKATFTGTPDYYLVYFSASW